MSNDSDGKKNGTPSTALKFLADNKLDLHSEKGAGLFLLADPEAGPMQFTINDADGIEKLPQITSAML